MIYAIGLDTDKTFINFLYWAKKSSALVTPINLRSLVQRGTWSIDVHGEAELEIDKTYYILTGEDTFLSNC